MSLWTGTLDLLFPPKCPFCRVLLEKESQGLCPKCQMTLPWLIGPNGTRPLRGTEGCVSPLAYDGLVVDAIHRYKFSGLRCYHKVFGQLMAQCAVDHQLTAADGVTWAPLSKKRLRERGYDQARLLAQDVGQLLDIPVVSTLRKVRHIPPQSERQDAAERKTNVAGAYAMAPKADVKGKRLILVDDVVTSGATLEECVQQLRLSGVEQVWCLTLARAGTGGGEGKIKEKTVENHSLTVYNER